MRNKFSIPGMSLKSKKKEPRSEDLPLAVFDCETDPFLHGRFPQPFAVGFYDGRNFLHFWGDSAKERFIAFLRTIPRHLIYAHNGGKFDFLFFLDHLEGDARIIHGRVVQAQMAGHEIRDSYAILPVGLSHFGDKLEIDYRFMEAGVREHPDNRARIVDYLRVDCVSLFDSVFKFRRRFGDRLTVASAAIKELEKFTPIPHNGPKHDATFRPFYMGGRVECFARGVIRRPLKVYDVNSMYPEVMRNEDHPASSEYRCSSTLRLDDPTLSFAIVDATSGGALPLRGSDHLEFPRGRHRFYSTVHELRAGVETGNVHIHGCLAAWYCARTQRFEEYVDHWVREKISAEERGDKAERIFAKLMLNSAYGKFGSNPENYFEYVIRDAARHKLPDQRQGWELYSTQGDAEIWRKPVIIHARSYYDVAVAASITGAARARLWRTLCRARGVVYCDTDSIICEQIRAPTHRSRLGAWKLEATGDRIAIAGKKTYALFQGDEAVKFACKGVQITPEQIETIAQGGTVDFYRDAPTMSLVGNKFLHRTVRMT